MEWLMSAAFHDIEEQAKNLPAEERARLAESLLESLRQEGIAEVEAAWDAEIQKRLAAYSRGEAEIIDGQTVLAELRQLVR
jgi:putative addiction module component (TIGR02574 family)